MSDVRDVLKFEVEPFRSIDVFSVFAFAIAYVVFIGLPNGIGGPQFEILTFVGNAAIALFILATLGFLSFLKSNLTRFHALEATEIKTLKFKYILRKSEIPITEIQAIEIEEKEVSVEGGNGENRVEYNYVGLVYLKGKKLKSVQLNRYDCLRLRGGFIHIKNLNHQIKFRESCPRLSG